MARLIALLMLALPVVSSAGEPAHNCAEDAKSRARQLLTFHFGAEDDRLGIRDTVKVLPSIKNPANPKHRLEVLEVWGDIYKGQYRMRFLYHSGQTTQCPLMGQEILEYAKP